MPWQPQVSQYLVDAQDKPNFQFLKFLKSKITIRWLIDKSFSLFVTNNCKG